jgi:argininosuccinate synthase
MDQVRWYVLYNTLWPTAYSSRWLILVCYSDPLTAPDIPAKFSIEFKEGIPVKLEVEGGETITGGLKLFKALNEIAGRHGVGRVDIVESRLDIAPKTPPLKALTDHHKLHWTKISRVL